jgi:hypothetical protein
VNEIMSRRIVRRRFACLLTGALLAGAGSARAQGDRVASAAERTLPLLSTATATATAADTTPPKPPVAAPAPSAIEVSVGKVKFGGLVQAWYVGGDQTVTNTFRVRRAELKFSGEITGRSRWTVAADLAKTLSMNNSYTTVDGEKVVTDGSVNQGSRLLQDAYVTLGLGGFTLDAGQHKLPVGLEGGATSPAKTDVVEKALFMTDRARSGGIADVRDLGVSLRGRVLPGTDLQLGLYNGSGESMGTVDRNEGKAFVGRVVHRVAVVPGLQLGASGVWAGEPADAPRKDRLGAEMLFASGPLKLQAEVMGAADGAVRRRGYYLHAGYRFGVIEPVARFDVWDPDTRTDAGASTAVGRDYLAGFNYLLDGPGVKLQGNLIRRTLPGVAEPTHLLMVNLQTAW